MLGLAIVSGVASVMNAVHLARVRGKFAVVGSSRFMEHLLRLPLGFYAQRMVGDLQQCQRSVEYAGTRNGAGSAAFEPTWFECDLLVLVAGMAICFGPDIVQRRRNRQGLEDGLAGRR